MRGSQPILLGTQETVREADLSGVVGISRISAGASHASRGIC